MLRIIRVGCFHKTKLIFRNFATKEASQKTIKYTDTINLPTTKFPQRLSATKRIEIEKKINEVKYIENIFYKCSNETNFLDLF